MNWSSIDMAPRDGTPVLVCQRLGGRWRASVMYWDRLCGSWRTDAVSGFEYEEDITDPTFWCPLGFPKK
jgi:hypothetical protein